MYDNRRLRFFASQPDIDIHQIIREAQSRWLRPVEVIEILRNYQQFRLNPVPPNKPPSGSLFLFDRKTLRFFRKDGHNWRKKKDGKTVREAHERLKAGSVDVLHCYYAHGEENANFQRRSYWMLEGAYEHIVLVHYREVTEGGRASAYKSIQDASAIKETIPVAINQNRPSSSRAASLSDNELTGPYKSPEIPETSATPVCSEEAESADEADETPASETQSSLLNQVSGQSKDLTSVDFDDLLRNPDAYLGQQTQTVTPSVALDISGWNELLENFRGTAATDKGLNFNSPFHKSYTRNNADPNVRSVYSPALPPIEVQQFFKSTETQQMDVDVQQRPIQKDTSNVFEAVDNQDCYRVSLPECAIKQEESTAYKKLDSFGRWMSREIGEDSQSSLISSSEHGAYWATLEDHGTLDEISSFSNHMHLDVGLSPSLSHHQQFSILDFSPDFAFSSEETKVIIAGSFLKGGSESTWYCMFGEIEVPAEVIREGVVRCKAPPHASGRVPLYITRGDRLACSEVREFEYRTPTLTNTKSTSSSSPSSSEYPQDEDVSLQTRFVRLLMDDAAAVSNKSSDTQVPERLVDVCKIRSLTSEVHKDWIDYEKKDHKSLSELTLQTLLKQNLQTWLLSKLYEDGKGTSVLDTQGQGILHMAAALGYDWAISPILSSGVLINFRDIHGWTALHWAAFRGREKVVSTLIAGGANPGLVTDPTPHYPSGRTPADLASTSGHRGMAGYLAELSLTTHLTLLTVKEQSSTNEIDSFSAALAGEKAVELISEKTSIERGGGDEHALLKDSLRAVRNAARAAALIHASFRQESFRRRREKQQGIIVDDEYGMSMEEIRSMTTALHSSSSSSSAGGGGGGKDKLHSAATTIQQKFRGWKGRRDFLLLRRRVVKIQAHVRGHQVRRKFRKFLWTVGILDKAVLRWRRKGAGLRGFRAAAAAAAATKTTTRSGAKDDDDDDDCCADSEKKEVTSDEDNEVLRAGRKQKEEAIQKAVSRVQSMVRSHEAREQYQRLQEAYLQAVNSDGGAAATVANEDFTMFGGGD